MVPNYIVCIDWKEKVSPQSTELYSIRRRSKTVSRQPSLSRSHSSRPTEDIERQYKELSDSQRSRENGEGDRFARAA